MSLPKYHPLPPTSAAAKWTRTLAPSSGVLAPISSRVFPKDFSNWLVRSVCSVQREGGRGVRDAALGSRNRLIVDPRLTNRERGRSVCVCERERAGGSSDCG